MSIRKKIYKAAFVLADYVLPEYNYCRWGNHIKTFLARKHMKSVGKNAYKGLKKLKKIVIQSKWLKRKR